MRFFQRHQLETVTPKFEDVLQAAYKLEKAVNNLGVWNAGFHVEVHFMPHEYEQFTKITGPHHSSDGTPFDFDTTKRWSCNGVVFVQDEPFTEKF